MRTCIPIGICFGLALAAQGVAEPLSAAKPHDIADYLRERGGNVDLTLDKWDDPLINVNDDGLRYSILFYGCTEGRTCRDIQFRAAFETDGEVGLRTINAWNRDRRFGRAYLDDDEDATIEHMLIGVDLLQERVFGLIVDEWAQGLADFRNTIDP